MLLNIEDQGNNLKAEKNFETERSTSEENLSCLVLDGVAAKPTISSRYTN